ncbi:Nitroreductase [Pyrodictium delaneyi]|uniref:Nitroreductase n=1 Tax=Pyrodictium delaneyi TaxID=1273541 RepID=A0A0P0N6U8_9CREN|nr:SagB/ThcOx family dehydrogenase [Pyrodictium delaneyi]ALL02055.1 Nitroreductase [Pyrodictium delaneyi]
MFVDDVCRAVRSFMARLGEGARRLFLRGVAEMEKHEDVAALYHYATMIEKDAYMDSPTVSWPGFFKQYYCSNRVELPEPLRHSGVDTLSAIRLRRSRRSYSPEPLSLLEISTILYHAVGIRGWDGDWPLRVYPSAGGLQPVEAYLVAERVEGLEPGLYHYIPLTHSLCLLRSGSYMDILSTIALGQEHIVEAPAALLITAVYARTASKYAARSYRYIHLDAGTVVQNVYLVAEALKLATVVVGAFYDEELCRLLSVDCYIEIPIAIMPIGKRL